MPPSHVVYLSNLPQEVSEHAIRLAFQEQNIEVASVQLLKKGSFNRHLNSGLACISLTNQLDVDNSCKLLDGQQLLGRPMIVRKDKYESDNHSYDP